VAPHPGLRQAAGHPGLPPGRRHRHPHGPHLTQRHPPAASRRTTPPPRASRAPGKLTEPAGAAGTRIQPQHPRRDHGLPRNSGSWPGGESPAVQPSSLPCLCPAHVLSSPGRWRAELSVRGGAPIIRICTAAGLPGLDRAAAHNGGLVRSPATALRDNRSSPGAQRQRTDRSKACRQEVTGAGCSSRISASRGPVVCAGGTSASGPGGPASAVQSLAAWPGRAGCARYAGARDGRD
jgi:hypothetical protein